MTVGTVVRLKSGGPDMTVVEVNGSLVNVFWFTDDETCVRDATFPVSALDEVPM